jgi:aspartate/methionine/tyrosine aminotransferase
MKIEPFEMERMQSQWENRVAHNLSESGVHPLSVEELLDPGEGEELLRERLIYVQSNGSEALRTAIAALYPGATASEVVVCNGTAEANFVCAWRLVEPGDEVVMVLPNYMQLWGVIRGLGGQVVPLHLREERGAWVLDVEALKRVLSPRTRLVVVCNPNNPTGAALSDEERTGLLAAVSRQGSWLLVDEVYRGAERLGGETPSFWGGYERLLVTCGLSKAYGLPGLRIGWVVGPAGMTPELWGRKDYTTISPGALSDVLARKALLPERRARILDRTRGILRANYPVLESWIRKRHGVFTIVPPQAGAIGYVRYAYKINSTELVIRLRDEQGVLIVPGDHFGMDGFLRVGFGNEPEDLRAGLLRIDALLDALPPP